MKVGYNTYCLHGSLGKLMMLLSDANVLDVEAERYSWMTLVSLNIINLSWLPRSAYVELAPLFAI